MDVVRFEVVSSKSCPFAQQACMALLEKGIAYSLVEINLDDQPGWFRALSPNGNVPLLRDGDAVIYESAVICEYLEDVCLEPPLMPTDALGRAKMRTWIGFANARFIPHVYELMIARERHVQERQASILRAALGRMEVHLASPDAGRFWIGDWLTYADLAFYPHLERFYAVEHYRGVAIPAECRRLKDWLAMMGERQSAREVARAPETHIRNWEKLVQPGGARSERPPAKTTVRPSVRKVPKDYNPEFADLGVEKVRQELIVTRWVPEKLAAARIWVEERDAQHWLESQADTASAEKKKRFRQWAIYISVAIGLFFVLTRVFGSMN
jgi:glutathione S-transferase